MSKNDYKAFQLTSYLSDGNAPYIEDLYEQYLKDPSSVDQQWQTYFEKMGNGEWVSPDISHKDIRQQFIEKAKHPKMGAPLISTSSDSQEKVDTLITAFRRFGHLNSNLDPLGAHPPTDVRLTLEHYDLKESDLKKTFFTRELIVQTQASLQQIYDQLRACYCQTIGIEYSRISDEHEREWLRQYVEQRLPATNLEASIKRSILKKLIAAEGLEKFLETRYPGQKRFSVEGGDVVIPLLDELAKRARSNNVQELIIGMAHRGRLNVLLNVLGQPSRELFDEFEGKKEIGLTTGDVKYHLGFSSDVVTNGGAIHLSLAFNPSHLEFINTVVLGSVRSRQERERGVYKHDYAIPVLIHGDAAFAGQGIVMETLSMSQTRAYHVGGTVHIILNNQLGFTTSHPHDARSSHYCSDLAKMIDAPVFHVNADDPEAVINVTQLALDYRMKFHKDIVIDLVCYRRHGHQEVDEPRATQPIMYQKIKAHPSVRKLYAQQLIDEKIVTQTEVEQWWNDYRDLLDQGAATVETVDNGLSHRYKANWLPYLNQNWRQVVPTAVEKSKIIELGKQLDAIPEHFVLQKNVDAIIQARHKMTAEEIPMDWGYAEIMAYATLLSDGYPVRFSGEDSRRGTFFHRHAFVFDQKTGESFMPLSQLNTKAHVQIYDSLLAEAGPMGFEYGYATADPKALVIWEAQFGDFANGAQVIIDQFISSAWQKWNRLSGLVLFLPHGNEAMGPEHSSARLERYLQLCAQDNMQVFVPTTPAQIFHLLRRQVLRPYRKPLIVMTPKSLLRHKLAVSSLDDLATGKLQLVIPEIDPLDNKKIRRVIFCCGKIYYELLMRRRDEKIDDIAIVRIEQLYPFPYEEISGLIDGYPNVKEVVWCQEEPKNQGAWFCTRDRLMKSLPKALPLINVSRYPMAAPATGYPVLYKHTQNEVIEKALGIKKGAV